MNAPLRLRAPEKVWAECEDCNGNGVTYEFRRYAGEAFAGEPYEHTCLNCMGTGGEMTDRRVCPDCSETLEDDGQCSVCGEGE